MKIILKLLLIFCLIHIGKAQNISLTTFGGYSENGIATMANVQLYLENNRSDNYEIGIYSGFLFDVNNIPVNAYSLMGNYSKKIEALSSKSNFILTYISAGGHIGYEHINKGQQTLDNGTKILSKSKVVYGPTASFHTDIFLSNHFSILPRVTYFYMPNSTVSKSRYFTGIGFKYTFL